MLALH
jgi:hypothetical protein